MIADFSLLRPNPFVCLDVATSTNPRHWPLVDRRAAAAQLREWWGGTAIESGPPLGASAIRSTSQSNHVRSRCLKGDAEVLPDAVRRLDGSGVTLVVVGLWSPDLDDVSGS